MWRGETVRIGKQRKRDIGGIEQKGILYLGEEGRVRPKKVMVKVGRNPLYEGIAHTVDQVLGWEITPPVSSRRLSAKELGSIGVHMSPEESEASYHEWLEGSTKLWMHPAAKYIDPYGHGGLASYDPAFLKKNDERFEKIAAFDFLIANGDRHSGNIIVSKSGVVYGIDHAFAFYGDDPLSFYEFSPTKFLYIYMNGRKLSPKVLRDLENIEEGDLRAALAPLNHPRKVDGVVARWKLLVQRGHFPTPQGWYEYFHSYGEYEKANTVGPT